MSTLLRSALITGLSLLAPCAQAEQAPGITATEIKIGQTKPYSGPASAYGIMGKVEAAYVQMINDGGGINGRKINLVSLDDAYSPPKILEQTRKLVEQDGVAFIFAPIGTPTNLATRKYLNDRKVPQLFVMTSSSTLADPARFPWTIPGILNGRDEAAIYAADVMENVPGAKIALLAPNDDSGRDYVNGFKARLGDRAKQIVAELKYETSDPTVDSQIVSLAASGADVFFYHATPKFSAQILRKKQELNWRPRTYVSVPAASLASVLIPAGLETAQGLISSAYEKDVDDPEWASDPGMKAYVDFMNKYLPSANKSDVLCVGAFVAGEVLVEILKRAGDDLSRENILDKARNLDFAPSMFLPGVRFKTTPENYSPIGGLRKEVFKGSRWVVLAD